MKRQRKEKKMKTSESSVHWSGLGRLGWVGWCTAKLIPGAQFNDPSLQCASCFHFCYISFCLARHILQCYDELLLNNMIYCGPNVYSIQILTEDYYSFRPIKVTSLFVTTRSIQVPDSALTLSYQTWPFVRRSPFLVHLNRKSCLCFNVGKNMIYWKGGNSATHWNTSYVCLLFTKTPRRNLSGK